MEMFDSAYSKAKRLVANHVRLDLTNLKLTGALDTWRDWAGKVEEEFYSASGYEWRDLHLLTISERLANELEKKGELVEYVTFHCEGSYFIWGRTCFGQKIYKDLVLQEVAEAFYADD